MDVFWSWPPVTRTLTAITLVTSVLCYTGFVPFAPILFLPEQIFRLPPKIPEIWRLVTPFFITGPKFSILMDTYFLFTYASGLERDSPRFTELGSFFVYVVFCMGMIVATSGMYLGSIVFLQPLILAFAYTFSQDNPMANVTIYILTFQAKYLPFALLAVTFILDTPQAALNQATGIIAAHAYDFLTRIWPTFGGGRKWIVTPDFVKTWFAGEGGPQVRGYGTAFGRAQTAPGREGWTGQRGPGRRLGGE